MASAQTPDPNPYTTAIRNQHLRIDGFVMRAAEKMPEDLYAFKATPDVRSFAEITYDDFQCRGSARVSFEVRR